MSKNSESVKRWRRKSKQLLVDALGGKCVCCGYTCVEALDFHHIDPSAKDFCISSIRRNPKRWPNILEEVAKCVLICSNCHREVHAGLRTLPTTLPVFTPQLRKRIKNYVPTEPCPICGKPKLITQITCSRSCAARRRYVVDWDSIDLIERLKSCSIVALADELGVSDMCIRKRLKKICG